MEKLATEKGKVFALQALAERREKTENEEQINNSMLYAGSPMYYYCKTCGQLADELPESHVSAPKKCCSECQALIDLDWMK